MKRSIKIVFSLIILILLASVGYFIVTQSFTKRAGEKAIYACRIEPKRGEYTSFEGDRVEIHFRIKNKGKAGWRSKGKNPVFLSYHLLDEEQKIIRYDNRRFPFPRKVKPAQTIEMAIFIRSPLDKGNYILEFDLVREGIAWFEDYGVKTASIFFSVKERKWPEDSHELTLDYGKYTRFRSSIDELNKIQKLIRLTLNRNEVAFDGKTGKVYGFSGGTDYPQIWLRDANTIIPVSRYFYDGPYLYSWLEEHLAFQKESGSLEDWIDSGGNSDKNTTETDQEANTVQAAFQIFKILGPRWLEKTIAGEKIIGRLEQALLYILDSRWSKEYGLVTGAHTADWGDVDMVDEDEEAIYVDDRTHWTADIYDQSMFYQASLNLAKMFDALGKKKKASFWFEKADLIKKNTDKWLWQKDKGFYRIHLHLDSLQHDFDEEEIFAMGGNTQALLAGLADNGKAKQIIENALERQKFYAMSTISGTLLPPYPQNVFKHPLLDDPFEYQNGAQWDWFGGKLILAMFQNGFSRQAKEKLAEIIKKNVKNRRFSEWDTKKGEGRGSDFFCGSAASIGRTIFEGYFGLKLGHNSLSLEPKLQTESAKIHAYFPTNDVFVAYSYSFNDEKNRIVMEYNSNFPQKGKMIILSPWQDSGENSRGRQNSVKVFIDGKETKFRYRKKNNDEYIEFESDFKNHKAEVYFHPESSSN